MKGVSAIIATILMLVITIGLAGTAYVYISGMLTGKTAQTISILDYSCTHPAGGVRGMTLVISNDGTADIANLGVSIYVDNQDRTSEFGAYAGGSWTAGANMNIPSHTTKPILTDPAATPAWLTADTHTVLISTVSNAQRISLICPT